MDYTDLSFLSFILRIAIREVFIVQLLSAVFQCFSPGQPRQVMEDASTVRDVFLLPIDQDTCCQDWSHGDW